MTAHHAEPFLEDGRWGWQCLTPGCRAEEFVASLAEAERGAERHEKETS